MKESKFHSFYVRLSQEGFGDRKSSEIVRFTCFFFRCVLFHVWIPFAGLDCLSSFFSRLNVCAPADNFERFLSSSLLLILRFCMYIVGGPVPLGRAGYSTTLGLMANFAQVLTIPKGPHFFSPRPTLTRHEPLPQSFFHLFVFSSRFSIFLLIRHKISSSIHQSPKIHSRHSKNYHLQKFVLHILKSLNNPFDLFFTFQRLQIRI